MVFCNIKVCVESTTARSVTILILIDGFLQFDTLEELDFDGEGHNPYFNRWFSAIKTIVGLLKSQVKSQSLF